MKIYAITFTTLTLLGCATSLSNIPLSKIPSGETAVTGRITAEKRIYQSGRLVRTIQDPYSSISFGLQHFEKIEDVPKQIAIYSDIVRINTDNEGIVSSIIKDGNYFAADLSVRFSSYPFGKLVELTKTRGVSGTLNFFVKRGVVNYFGHIHIIDSVEYFDDKNQDSFIDKSEFNSVRVTFNAMSGGEEKFPSESYWESTAFVVSDESNQLKENKNITPSLAIEQSYYNF